jgi:hypothetical protein
MFFNNFFVINIQNQNKRENEKKLNFVEVTAIKLFSAAIFEMAAILKHMDDTPILLLEFIDQYVLQSVAKDKNYSKISF